MAQARILGARAATPVTGIWELAALPPGAVSHPGELADRTPHWIPATEALPVAAALRAAGEWQLDDPRDLDSEDWWYRCRFAADFDEPVRIHFNGLATLADAWINGRHVLRSENMFVAHAVDLSGLNRDENELVLCFHALTPRLAAKHPRPRWRTRLVGNQSLRWYRTSLLGRMPGWCPPVPVVGPWRPILIEASRLNVDEADVRAAIDNRDGVVRIRLRISHPSDCDLHGTAFVGECAAPFVGERRSEEDRLLTAVVRVPQPELWWPHTHGPQPLYEVTASIAWGDATDRIALGRIGFRTLGLDRDRDGKGFGLVINDAPVFCRGACWTPLDLARCAADPAEYRSALEQFRVSGMNMVRVGGTMTYETEAFHDLCDELGVLVWQDFMFANMDYPWTDEAFAREGAVEVTQVLAALQSRPSLAVVCGSSEVDQQAAMMGLDSGARSTRLVEERLGPIVRAIAPDAVWVPSTPHGGTFPFQVNSGVSHYYGVGAYRRPLDDARLAGVRFAAECLAFSNVPEQPTIDLLLRDGEAPGHHPRWKARVPRDVGAGWDFEDVRDHYLARLFDVSPVELRASDPERYLALSRVATGEVMLRTFSEWRRPGSTCRGALVWFARDLWPGAGWGIVDSTGRPKAAYWYLKRVLRPVALLMSDEGLNGLWLHAVNDTDRSIAGVLDVAIYREGHRRGPPRETKLDIPARGALTVHADELFDRFVDLSYAYRFGPPEHDVVAARLRDHNTQKLLGEACFFPGRLPSEPLRDVGLAARAEATNDGVALALTTDRFAYAVSIDVDGFLPDDNYFNLQPGESRCVVLTPTQRPAVARGSISALNVRGSMPFTLAETVDAA